MALLVVLAVIGGGAGVSAADHSGDNTCGALHDGEANNADGTEGDDDPDDAHDACHGDHDKP